MIILNISISVLLLFELEFSGIGLSCKSIYHQKPTSAVNELLVLHMYQKFKIEKIFQELIKDESFTDKTFTDCYVCFG